jgi:hypothetical protein
MNLHRILLAPDADPTAGDPPADPPKAPPPPKGEEKGPTTVEEARRFVEKHGDAAEAVRVLMAERFKDRDRIRELEGRLPEGSVVLRGEDARRWQQFAELGVSPADVKTLRQERQSLAEWRRGREQADTLAEAASLHGWKPPVLTRFAKADGLDVVVDDSEEKDKDGRAVRKGFVVTRGEGGQEAGRVALDQYAEEHWKGELDALREPPARPTAATRPDPFRPTPPQPDRLDRELAPSRLL